MSSKAHVKFSENLKMIEALDDLRRVKDKVPNPVRETLSMSGYVLLVTIWESYVEDLTLEVHESLVQSVASQEEVPESIRRSISASIKADPHDFSPWALAGDGWKKVASARAARSVDALNAPDSDNVKALMLRVLGIDDVTSSWTWKNMLTKTASGTLDQILEARHQIVHTGSTAKKVDSNSLNSSVKHIAALAEKTDETVLGVSWPMATV